MLNNKKCVFCDIVEGKSQTKILHESEETVIFRDIRPCGVEHLQVIPKEHIINIEYLTSENIPLLEKMYAEGRAVLRKLCPEADLIFGFHVPPLISVHHLHLHCLALPIVKFKYRFKFHPESGLWISYEDVLKTLQDEKQTLNGFKQRNMEDGNCCCPQ